MERRSSSRDGTSFEVTLLGTHPDGRGKVIVVMNNDPEKDPTLFAGVKRLYYGRWTYKFEEAARRGAFFHPAHNWFVSAAHEDADIDAGLAAAEAGMKAVVSEFGRDSA